MARTKKADVTNSSANRAAYAKEYAQKGPKYARSGSGSGSSSSNKDALNSVKMQAASDVGVTLNQGGYNGQLTSKEAGSIGGQMVKKMIESYMNK